MNTTRKLSLYLASVKSDYTEDDIVGNPNTRDKSNGAHCCQHNALRGLELTTQRMSDTDYMARMII